MILETMIVGLCMGGYECERAPQAYYLSKPELRSWVKKQETKYKKIIRTSPYEVPMTTSLGFAFFMAGGKTRIRLTDHISIKVSKDLNEIKYTYVF